MSIKFNLLLQNPELKKNNYQLVDYPYLQNNLAYDLYLPNNINKPFILSCFAISIDGKLCYPDIKSGFSIAKENHLATQQERDADWFSLLLTRTISDAVIIGRNSLEQEYYKYTAEINIPELKKLRLELNKADNLLHIIITRDCNLLNFNKELLLQNNNIPVVIFCKTLPNNPPLNFKIKNLENLNLIDLKQIITTKDFSLPQLIKTLFTLGIKTILNESPYYHHILQELQLLNETWINTSTTYIGGQITSLGMQNKSFTANNHPHYTILSMHNIGYNFIYTRYKVSYK